MALVGLQQQQQLVQSAIEKKEMGSRRLSMELNPGLDVCVLDVSFLH